MITYKINKITLMMPTVEKATEEFLSKHWNVLTLGNRPDHRWSEYNFVGPVDKGDMQGCYALVASGEVIYIGLGASRGGGIYDKHGIGARLNQHVLRWDRESGACNIAERKYVPKGKWLKEGIDKIYTFGFDHDHGYLACALEAYLISTLRPNLNIVKTS